MISSAALRARQVLQDHGMEKTAGTAIEDFIIFYNGLVQEKPLPYCDGRLVMKNGRSIVTVNANIEFPAKRRFVLAHELGHILLHAGRDAAFSDDYASLEAYRNGPQEREANDFASELLLPVIPFQQACAGKKFGMALIQSLAEQFNTSLTSAVYRYVDYGPHPICVFYSKDGIVQYYKRATEFRNRIIDYNRLAVPAYSVAQEYYAHNRIYIKKDADQMISKSTWCELWPNENDSDMMECCIITPRYNTVLSIIWAR